MIFEKKEAVVKLRNYTPKAYDDAIAAARTCYSTDIIEPEAITEKQRDYIGPLTFNAGHHTVYQHATFEFSLENVSRHFIWSVLHSFPFYNSDQQSQRYVRLKEIRAFIPPMEPSSALDLYQKAIVRSFEVYEQLGEILKDDTRKIIGDIRHFDKHPHERIRKWVEKEADKKAIEVARYVLPIATYTNLVYTCSGLVLHRLWRLLKNGDVPWESQIVVNKMVEAAKAVAPDFFSKIGDEPLEKNQIPEHSFFEEPVSSHSNTEDWDKPLGSRRFSNLIDFTRDAKTILATSLRYALGHRAFPMSDEALIDFALNPRKNFHRVDKINLLSHSPLSRPLQNVHYTFVKRLSHSADSQNQRHRMVPGARPFLQLVDSRSPDYYTPLLIEKNPRANSVYAEHMDTLWEIKNRLLHLGVEREFAQYVLPNAMQIRFVESGSLLHFLHKWTLRTCLNAQEEIFRASMEEVEQVCRAHPFLANYIGPPCVIRNGVVTPRCTEGDKFCGVTVWKSFPHIERRL